MAQGAVAELGQGGFVWSAVVEAPTAAAIRLQLSNVYLPSNTELFIYTDDGEMAGPYVGRGPHNTGSFTTHTLRSSRVKLQLRYTGSDTARVLSAVRFDITDVGVMDYRFTLARLGRTDGALFGFCSFNAECVENAETTPRSTALSPRTTIKSRSS